MVPAVGDERSREILRELQKLNPGGSAGGDAGGGLERAMRGKKQIPSLRCGMTARKARATATANTGVLRFASG